MGKTKKFTTMEIVLMALLAVANAVLTFYLAFVNKALTAFAGPIGTSVTVGIYMIYGLLAMYIIRKPGSAFLTYLIGATVQTILGISYGMVAAYVAAICYAIAVEAIFAMFRYKKWGYFPLTIASVGAVLLWFPCAAYLFGYLEWGMGTLVVTLIVRCLSGVILCGLVCKWIGDGLGKTGLLRFYEIAAVKQRGM